MTGPPAAVGRDGLSDVDRRALLSVAVQFFVNGAVWSSVIARFPEVRDRAGVSVGGLGLALTVGGGIGLIGSAVAGRLIERWGTKRILVGGSCMMIGAVLAVALATSPALLVVGVGAFMFADVLVDIAMNLQGSWISARRRVPVMNRLHGLWSLGTVGGGLTAAAAASLSVSLPAHVLVVAVVTAVLVVVVARGLLPVDEDHDPDTAGEPPGRSPWRPMALLSLAGAFALVVEQTNSDWAALRLTDDFGSSAATAGLAYVAFTAGMAVGRFGGDTAQARLGRDRLHHIATTMAVVGTAVAALVPDRWIAVAAYAVAGGGIATFFPRIYDDAARLPGRRGAGLGAMTAGSRLAGFIAPSIVGAVAATGLAVGDAVAIVTLPCFAGFVLVTARRPAARAADSTTH